MVDDNNHSQQAGHGQQQQQNVGRRLAVNACTLCRERKTKCDEARPSCGRCMRLSLSCYYVESASAREFIPVADFNERLQRIETKIDLLSPSENSSHWHPTSKTQGWLHGSSPSPWAETSPHGRVGIPQSPFTPVQRHLAGSDSIPEEREAELAIPRRHFTAPQNMLLWPCCPVQFRIEDIRYPLTIEVHRTKTSSAVVPPRALEANRQDSSWLDGLSIAQFRRLTASYFTHFHPRCMILNEHEFHQRSAARALMNAITNSHDNCLVLLVLAIGSISAVEEGDLGWLPSGQASSSSVAAFEGTGLAFFTSARHQFADIHDVSWLSVQCWLLIAFYCSLQLQIHDQWQAVNQACTTVLILLQINPSPTPFQCQLFWVAYLQESQILAELDFPPSGISRLENTIPLPFAVEEEHDESQKVYQFFFLAEIALRRLLNRVHSHLYNLEVMEVSASRDSPATPPAPSSPITYELDHQLEIWRSHLPSSLQFDTTTSSDGGLINAAAPRSVREKMVGTLRSRYFAAKAIIFRPFVYRILHSDDTEAPMENDLARAKISLESALQVPLHAGLLCDNLRLVPLLINPSRSFFAAAIQFKFISMRETNQPALPHDWQLINLIRSRLAADVAPFSPIISHDLEVLRILDSGPLDRSSSE